MPFVDQFSDPAFGTLYRQVTRMPALEGFIKSASVDAGDADSLPDSAFAWPAERKYPIHTPEHAALSYAYSKVASAVPDAVMANLKQAIDLYQVPEYLFEEVGEKVASEKVAYVLPEYQYLPVNSPEQVKVAQEQLLGDIQKMEVEDRATAAANLVKQADALNVPVKAEVLKLAGLTVSDTRDAADWIEARTARLTAEQGVYKTAYETLANELRRGPKEVADRTGLLKVAAVLAEMDAATGVDRYYDRKLPDALRTVFNTTKLASNTVDLGGVQVPVEKLMALPASFWEDLGGAELAEEIAPGGKVDPSKLVAVVDTLPLDLKMTLKAQVR